MRALGGALAGLVGIVGVAVLIATINGGYVYRVQCPQAGHTETEWTYRWESVVPYIGYSREGCTTHTATRLALDKVGVWELDDDGASANADVEKGPSVGPRDRRVAAGLASSTEAVSVEFARERRVAADLQQRTASGVTPALRREALSVVETGSRRLLRIKRDLDQLPVAADPDLAETQRLLSLWLAMQVQANRLLLTATSRGDLDERAETLGKRLSPVVGRLQELSVEVQAKYPNVRRWDFLPA
jgi:hypothetical protein